MTSALGESAGPSCREAPRVGSPNLGDSTEPGGTTGRFQPLRGVSISADTTPEPPGLANPVNVLAGLVQDLVDGLRDLALAPIMPLSPSRSALAADAEEVLERC